MKTLNILIFLPVLLLAHLSASGDIKCYSDFSKDGFSYNRQCQVSFKLLSDNACPVVTSAPPRYSSVGMKFNEKIDNKRKVEKVLEITEKAYNRVNDDNCRFDGDLLVCNCGRNLCNKNRKLIWNILVNTIFDLSDECRPTFIERAWEEVKEWPTTDAGNSSVIVSPSLSCLNSNTSAPVVGEFCIASFTVLPGTCYITGQPVLSAAKDTDEDCISKNTIRIKCNTNNCNGNIDILKEEIADGFNVVGGAKIEDCKKQLELSIDFISKTTEIPTTTLPPTTIQPSNSSEFMCDLGWKMSVRPGTKPYCFKHFNILFTGSYYDLLDLESSYYTKYKTLRKVTRAQSEAICSDKFNASLPIIQYQSDWDALGKSYLYLGAKKECPTGQFCQFSWEELNGLKVPIAENHFLGMV